MGRGSVVWEGWNGEGECCMGGEGECCMNVEWEGWNREEEYCMNVGQNWSRKYTLLISSNY
jgi:hypothetical protein